MKKITKKLLDMMKRNELVKIVNRIKGEAVSDFASKPDLKKIIENSEYFTTSEDSLEEVDETTSQQQDQSQKSDKTEEPIKHHFNGKLSSNILSELFAFMIKEGNIKIIDEDDNQIQIPNKIIFYRDLDINLKDDYIIETQKPLGKTPIFIVNKKNEFCGYFNHHQISENKYYLILDKSNINIDKLKKFAEANLVIFSAEDEEAFIDGKIDISNEDIIGQQISIDIDCKELEESKNRLAIDFGTSNTAIGTYTDDDDIEIVDFINSSNNNELIKILPTIVYVKNCEDKDNIEYIFGYDAKKIELDNHFKLKGSIFYGIKRWVNELDSIEDIRDEFGNKQSIKKREIIKAYLSHILEIANHHFKMKFIDLHFSAPVKMKSKYNEMFKSIFPAPDYNISSTKNSSDEGFSIIYNYICENHKTLPEEQDRFPQKGKWKIMIVDSGGGTTDLASCEWFSERTDKGMLMNIETEYEDGDSNFGGNNLSYRIMQFLKIKLANVYQSEIKLEDNIKYLLKDQKVILKMVEDDELSKIYTKLDEEYAKAEALIPTIFTDNKIHKNRKSVSLIKQNFYLLWNCAEIFKKEFFKKNDLLMIGFDKDDKNNSKIKLPDIDILQLHIFKNGQFEEINKLPEMSITIKEISNLIYGDIYNVLNKLVGKMNDKALLDYHKFVLSGQTCKISLFDELFKEFVPGRKLRDIKLKDNDSTLNLKLQCIKGSIKFIRDLNRGVIVMNLNNKKTKLRNKVSVMRPDKKLMLSRDKIKIQLFDESNATQIRLLIEEDNINEKDKTIVKNNQPVRECMYDMKFAGEEDKDYKKLDLDDILKDEITLNIEWKEKVRKDINNAPAKSRIIFLIPTEDNFGFKLFELYKTKNSNFLFYGAKTFYFEKNLSEMSFFNGRK